MNLQELVNDVYCIIEAMIARSSDVVLLKPQLVDIPQYLLGDSDRLRGILLNLYTNAAKFTRRGAISLRVSVRGATYRPQAAQHAAIYTPEKQVRTLQAMVDRLQQSRCLLSVKGCCKKLLLVFDTCIKVQCGDGKRFRAGEASFSRSLQQHNLHWNRSPAALSKRGVTAVGHRLGAPTRPSP